MTVLIIEGEKAQEAVEHQRGLGKFISVEPAGKNRLRCGVRGLANLSDLINAMKLIHGVSVTSEA